MKRTTIVAGLSVAGVLLASLAAPLTAEAAPLTMARLGGVASAVTTSSFASTIYSPSTDGCVDVPGGAADINAYLYNSACQVGLEEQFTFVPVSAANGTYAIVNQASSMCMTEYRSQPRQIQGICVPVPTTIGSNALWYLVPLDVATHTYELQPVYRNHGKCLSAGATGQTFPTGGLIPNLDEAVCNTADPTQSFVISGAN